MLVDERAVRENGPRPAAERDDVRGLDCQSIAERCAFDFTKLRLAVFVNYHLRCAPFAFFDKLIQINHRAGESAGECCGDGRFARAHEARDDDWLCALAHLSITDSSNSKNSGKETPTHSLAPTISDSPSAMSAAIAKAIAMR